MSVRNESIQGSLSVSRDVVAGGDFQARGNSTFDHDVTVKGWLNANNVNVANKGMFSTLDDLKKAYPNPQDGWLAIVGTSLPSPVYGVKNGQWVATGGNSGEVQVELTEYLQSRDITDVADMGGKMQELTKNGQTVYPATTTDAVVHPDLGVSSSMLIGEVNVSAIFPTGGIDGSNKYTLETAIAMIPASLRTVGIKCSDRPYNVPFL